jgi:hypothetical protein
VQGIQSTSDAAQEDMEKALDEVGADTGPFDPDSPFEFLNKM